MSAPLLLPVRASEAVALADLLFQSPPTPARLLARLPTIGLQHTKVFTHTLAPDPIHANSWYLLVANASGEYWLLHLTSASAPASTLFPQPLLLARARTASGFEIVANAIPAMANLGAIVSTLAPHLLARASSVHDIWSIPHSAAWPSFASAIPQRHDLLPGVRSTTSTWEPYLPILLSPRSFSYIRIDTPPDISASDAHPFSRFSIRVDRLDAPRQTASHIRHLRTIAGRSIDIELDLSNADVKPKDVLAYLNDLRLLNASVEGIEVPQNFSAESLSSPQLAITIAAASPGENALPGRIHWKLSSFAT